MTAFFMFAAFPLAVFFVVLVLPFVMGALFSFTNWDGVEISQFVGFKNYIATFSDQRFMHSMLLTIEYVACSVLLVNLFGFLLALLLNTKMKARNFLRSIFFVPNMVGGILLGFIWQFVFNRILLYLGQITGWQAFANSWLVSPTTAFWAMVVVTVWQQSGYMMLIYLAGLVDIPSDVIEAANIDGASSLTQLFRIKIPMMIPSFTICVFMTLKNAFMMFDVNLSLTNGGPYNSTELVSLNIYNDAFLSQNYSLAGAKSMLFFIFVGIIALIQVYAFKRREL